ncbi:MAG: DUF4249 family protein [Bacteroidales bacterium]|nr:DUF4249 family protein [Bacteroidales bacterium]
MKKLFIPILLIFTMLSCREDFVIDLEEGSPMIGVEGSFTDEYKRHEVILSYTADFYNADEIKMVTGAKVAVTDGVDTIPYLEQKDQPGHYLTDFVAGHKNTMYNLLVEVPDETEGVRRLFAECYMNDNVEEIDSIVLKNNPSYAWMPMMDTIYFLYPYFQSLPDPTIVYLINVYEDGVPQNDTLLDANTIPMAGYAGYYVNGPEMLEDNMEIPVCMITESELTDGKVIRLDLLSIPYDYMQFLYSVKISMGNNPMMGPPSNVLTNIQPAGSAVGWFYAASVVSKELIYHPKE